MNISFFLPSFTSFETGKPGPSLTIIRNTFPPAEVIDLVDIKLHQDVIDVLGLKLSDQFLQGCVPFLPATFNGVAIRCRGQKRFPLLRFVGSNRWDEIDFLLAC